MKQVSVSARMSRELSPINSWSRYGLSMILVTAVADVILKQEKDTVGSIITGPGLSSTFPDSKKSRVIRYLVSNRERLERVRFDWYGCKDGRRKE